MGRRIVAGILAHVDAGKTTLSEALLYRSGGIRRLGRVDHGDAFLDTETLEKRRGITIHAHQASVRCGDLDLILLDTPGHVDFAAETERVLRVLDYAILVVSGTDGVQGHTETLWRLLARYQVPTFIFVNKMDAPGADRGHALDQLRRRFGDGVFALPAPGAVPDGGADDGSAAGDARISDDRADDGGAAERSAVAGIPAPMLEDIATLDESAMEEYLDTGSIGLPRLRAMVAERRLFPVCFGSALKLDGVDDLMATLEAYVREPQWPAEFGARIYKVSHDAQHNRLTWLKVTGGTLKAKAVLTNGRDGAQASGGAGASGGPDMPGAGVSGSTPGAEASDDMSGVSQAGSVAASSSGVATDDVWREKADQVRLYNGAKFDIAAEVPAGGICAVTGLTRTFPGEGLGFEADAESPAIQPVLTYTVLPAHADAVKAGDGAAAVASTAAAATKSSKSAKPDKPTKPSAKSSASDGGAGTDAGNGAGADFDANGGAGAEAQPTPQFDELTLHRVIAALRELEDEDPLLHVVWQERLREVHVQLMGAVQLEVIQQVLHDRFGLDVSFGPGGILYRETVTASIEGVGHFEPLRHYAEAHIRIEPGEPGSGVQVASELSENVLDRNWQRLVMTHLREKEHLGVLVGAPLTDVRLTLVAGRAHLKHTEGGDFRQATYRAVRQGLMELRAGVSGRPDAAAGQTEAGFVHEAMASGTGYCRVLEPWYRFRLEVPQDMIGRAMSDIQRMSGTFAMGEDGAAGGGAGVGYGTGTGYGYVPGAQGGAGYSASGMAGVSGTAGAGPDDTAVLTGECPVAQMRDYAMDVNAYTHGRGHLTCTFAGYRPCHDEERVVREARYDPESDLENTPDSVFCAHGAGYPVKWYKVPEFAHVGYVDRAK